MLDSQIDSLRETISTVEQGQQITYAYDVALAHKLYTDLFEPFEAELAQARHLIFEPDGAMLRMPPNPPVVDRASVDLYNRRVEANPQADFDFRRIKWFGRDRDISTAVSPRSFVGLFTAPPGTTAVAALRKSQQELMDDADTSHPFYWSAFAAVGDGDTAVIRAPTQIAGKR